MFITLIWFLIGIAFFEQQLFAIREAEKFSINHTDTENSFNVRPVLVKAVQPAMVNMPACSFTVWARILCVRR
ncbi:MAG: hypothetical protein ACLS6O_01495 [Bifidobacterium sp.]